MTPRRSPAVVTVAAGAVALAASLSACSSAGPKKPATASRSTTTVGAAPTTSTTAAGGPTTTATSPSTTVAPAGTPATTVTPSGPATTPAAPATKGAPGTAPANPASPVDTTIKVYSDCTNASVEPAGIVLACADYGELLSGLKWSTWTAGGATGVGTFVYNDCKPDCASGHQHSVAGMHVTLTDPVPGAGGQTVWSRIQFSPPPPGGFPSTQSLPTRPV